MDHQTHYNWKKATEKKESIFKVMFTCSLYRGKPIKKPYSLVQRAAKACEVEAPTSTSVRHAAETNSAKILDPNKHATYTSEDTVVEVVEAIGHWVEECLLKRLH